MQMLSEPKGQELNDDKFLFSWIDCMVTSVGVHTWYPKNILISCEQWHW